MRHEIIKKAVLLGFEIKAPFNIGINFYLCPIATIYLHDETKRRLVSALRAHIFSVLDAQEYSFILLGIIASQRKKSVFLFTLMSERL